MLVATDIAARGIDVDGISHVINYDLPNIPESYVHRIGRTARAGAEGIAISLCSHDEVPFLRDIEKLIRMTIPSTDQRRQRQAGPRRRAAAATAPSAAEWPPAPSAARAKRAASSRAIKRRNRSPIAGRARALNPSRLCRNVGAHQRRHNGNGARRPTY